MIYQSVKSLIVDHQQLFLLMVYVNLVEMVRKHLMTVFNALKFIHIKLVDQEKDNWIMVNANHVNIIPSCHQTNDDAFPQIVVNTNTHLRRVIVLSVAKIKYLH